jgi:hypothetical protein
VGERRRLISSSDPRGLCKPASHLRRARDRTERAYVPHRVGSGAHLRFSFGALFLNVGVEHADWLGFASILLMTAIALSSVGIVTGAITLVVERGEAVAGMRIFGWP